MKGIIKRKIIASPTNKRTEVIRRIRHLSNDKIEIIWKTINAFDSQLNTETINAIEDVNNNRNMSKTFDGVDELMADLNA